LTPPASDSVTSQQYRTLPIIFATPARSRLTSESPGSSFIRDIGQSPIQQRIDFANITP
jgi:hypothetical protein